MSPKRRLDQHLILSCEDAYGQDAESPRTKFARRMRDLNIGDTARSRSHSPCTLSPPTGSAPPPGLSNVLQHKTHDSVSPGAEIKQPTNSTLLPCPDLLPPPDLRPSDLPPPDLPPSDLPPSDLPPSDLPPSDLPPSDLPPSCPPPSDPPPPDSEDLWWDEDEITGHLIDPNDPNDDGEGINGIGFRPTPAMASRRIMKQRQQINDFKAREKKEERQKRLERRKCNTRDRRAQSEDPAGGHATVARRVRFA